MSTDVRYPLAQFIFEDDEVVCDKIKITRKMDTEEYTSCNSYTAYATNVTGETFDWELSDVDPLHWEFFHNIMDNQLKDMNELPLVGMYGFNQETGDLQPKAILYGAYATEISGENMDPFSVKGSAQRMKKL